MSLKNDPARRIPPRKPRNHIGAAGKNELLPHFNFASLKKVQNKLLNLGLRMRRVEGRIDAVNPYEVRKRVNQFRMSHDVCRPQPVFPSVARNLALSVFKKVRDPSSPSAPQDDSAEGFPGGY